MSQPAAAAEQLPGRHSWKRCLAGCFVLDGALVLYSSWLTRIRTVTLNLTDQISSPFKHFVLSELVSLLCCGTHSAVVLTQIVGFFGSLLLPFHVLCPQFPYPA